MCCVNSSLGLYEVAVDDMSRRLDNLEATIQSGGEKKPGLAGSKS